MTDTVVNQVNQANPQDLILGLYMALFDRAADSEGYSFWIDYLHQQPGDDWVTQANANTGATTFQQAQLLGQAFVTSQSAFFDETYGGLDNSQFINALYTNIGGSAGDPSGVQFWAGQLQDLENRGVGVQAARAEIVGAFTLALIDFNPAAATGLSPSQYQDAIHRQETIENKIEVSRAYLTAASQPGDEIFNAHSPHDDAYQAAIRVLDKVTFDHGTVNAAIVGINNAVAHHDLSFIS